MQADNIQVTVERRQTIFRCGGTQADNIQRWWNAGRQYSEVTVECRQTIFRGDSGMQADNIFRGDSGMQADNIQVTVERRQTIFRGGGMQAENIQRWWNAGRQYSEVVERRQTIFRGSGKVFHCVRWHFNHCLF